MSDDDKFLILANLKRFFDKYKTHTHTAEQILGLPTSMPADGGNADTLDGRHADSFIERLDYNANDVFSISSNDSPYWHKWVWVNGSNIPNAPESILAWYYVLTYGSIYRGVQIAYGCFDRQRKTFIRYVHDSNWSNWEQFAYFSDIQRNISNPNLLINPDFRINQRGKTSYTNGYSVDRWKIEQNAKVTVTDSGVLLKNSGTDYNGFIQIYEGNLDGKTVTLSVKMSGSGTVRIGSWGVSTKSFTLSDSSAIYSNTFTAGNNGFGIWLSQPGEYANIEWAKLELGSIATPFVPPDPATELDKCQRFYLHLNRFRVNASEVNVGLNTIRWFVPYYKQMRRAPTVTILGLYIDGLGDADITYNYQWASYSSIGFGGNIAVITSSIDESVINLSTFGANHYYPLVANDDDAGIILDAEI